MALSLNRHLSLQGGPVDPKKVVADPNWLPVWKGAWMGMAKTDPKAKWLYQGWAIRGWSVSNPHIILTSSSPNPHLILT